VGSGYSVVVPKRLEEKREKCAKTSVPLSFVCPHEYKPFVTYRIIRTPNDTTGGYLLVTGLHVEY
jgi:hypothetical protein